VIKYADNILKEFATSVSIIVTSFVSYYFLNDFIPNFIFILGSLIVLISTFLYNYELNTATKSLLVASNITTPTTDDLNK